MPLQNKEKVYQRIVFLAGMIIALNGMINLIQTLVAYYSGEMLQYLIEDTVVEPSTLDGGFLTSMLIIIMAVAVISTLISLLIGISAMREAKGRQKNCIYLVISSIVLLLMAIAFLADVAWYIQYREPVTEWLDFFLSIAYLILMAALIHCAKRLRRIHASRRIAETRKYVID